MLCVGKPVLKQNPAGLYEVPKVLHNGTTARLWAETNTEPVLWLPGYTQFLQPIAPDEQILDVDLMWIRRKTRL